MIYALLDRSNTISVEHLQAALALCQYAHRSAEVVFGISTGDSLADRLLRFVQTDPGITRRNLRRKFSTSESNEEIVRALGKLQDQGLAHRRIEKKTKPSERWFLGPEPNANANSDKSQDSSKELADLSLAENVNAESGGELADLSLAQRTNGEMEKFTI